MNNVLKFGGMILSSCLAFAGVYFLKTTLNQTIPDKGNLAATFRTLPHLALDLRFWIALCCYGAALGVFLFLLHEEEVSKIFSMAVGMNVLLTVIGATILLGDTLSVARIIGVLFIIAGIYIINATK